MGFLNHQQYGVIWAVLIVMSSHEQRMAIFPILHDEQMSNRVGLSTDQLLFSNINFHQGEVTPSTVDGSEILLLGAFQRWWFQRFFFFTTTSGNDRI